MPACVRACVIYEPRVIEERYRKFADKVMEDPAERGGRDPEVAAKALAFRLAKVAVIVRDVTS